jgi:hypothetical protein
VVGEVTESIKSQGEFDPHAFELELGAAEMAARSETLRWLVGKEVSLTTKGDVYGRRWEVDRFEEILTSVMKREYNNNLICIALREGLTSVRDISNRTGLELANISHMISDLEKSNQIVFKGHSDGVPVFENAS